MNKFKCYKCEIVIDNVINDDSFSKPATDNTIYVCENCASIESKSLDASNQCANGDGKLFKNHQTLKAG